MPKTNTIGSVLVCLVLIMLIGYAFSRALSLDWMLYFKVGGMIIAIAALVGFVASGGDRDK
jgi:hypothetical protein